MRSVLVGTLIVGSLVAFEASAQERAGDAALGAVSGAVILGPIGAVAGALVGYAAGPSIANSWGLRHSAPRPRYYRVRQSSLPQEPATGSATPAFAGRASAAKKPPPVQGLY